MLGNATNVVWFKSYSQHKRKTKNGINLNSGTLNLDDFFFLLKKVYIKTKITAYKQRSQPDSKRG